MFSVDAASDKDFQAKPKPVAAKSDVMDQIDQVSTPARFLIRTGSEEQQSFSVHEGDASTAAMWVQLSRRENAPGEPLTLIVNVNCCRRCILCFQRLTRPRRSGSRQSLLVIEIRVDEGCLTLQKLADSAAAVRRRRIRWRVRHCHSDER